MLSLILPHAMAAAMLGATPPAPADTTPSEAERALTGRSTAHARSADWRGPREAALVPPGSAPASSEARLTGALTTTLRGEAGFGPVVGEEGAAPFMISLGAYSEDGAIVLIRSSGARPRPGTYRITSDEPTGDGIRALVLPGSPSRPTGAFQAHHGTVTIVNSTPSAMSGWFEMDARGFLASAPALEDRELTVRGSFTASPPR